MSTVYSDAPVPGQVSANRPHIKQEPSDDVAITQFASQTNLNRKRKHDDSYLSPLSPVSPGLPEFPTEKRAKLRRDSSPSQLQITPLDTTPAPVTLDATRMEEFYDTVRSQFGFEILRKHNELRLINNELAKCQTALEQLRRCSLIPYPVNVPTPTQMLDIAKGKGPAVKLPGESVAKWAPPFGVTDGPYSRHYAKWLLPDAVFDGGIPEALLPIDARGVRIPQPEYIGKRSTRSGSNAKHGSFAMVADGHNSHAAAPAAAPAKEKHGLPSCIVRRSDGVMVRLGCLHCDRAQFSSTQGFINHCRIAHKVDYKSHDEAGFKCGVVLEGDDLVAVTAPSTSMVAPAAIALPAPVTANGFTAVDNRAPVHPYASSGTAQSDETLVKLGRDYHQNAVSTRGARVSDASATTVASTVSKLGAISSKFEGSSQAPNLSRFMALKNVSIDLADMMLGLADDPAAEDSDEYDSDGDAGMTDVPPPRNAAGTRPTLVIKRQGTILSRCASEEAKSPNQIGLGVSPTGMSPRTGAPSLVYDSGSEEDDVASVASGVSPNVDVADASCDEDSALGMFNEALKRGASPMDVDFDVEKRQKGKSVSKAVRPSKFTQGGRQS